jgi:myo-inositol-1(or 4)-monophosphatase
MNDYLTSATDIALRAGELLREMAKDRHQVTLKGDIDLVTEVDVKSEALIVQEIRRRYPDHGILAEESGADREDAEYLWIVDPLDGTTNYAHGFPIYAVSIGLERRGEVIAGVVYDPNLDELFTAEKGSGAFLNGEPIHVSPVDQLDKSLLATGFPYYYREEPEKILRLFTEFSLCSQGIRRAGAAAIDFVALACGRFDGYWEYGIKPWDMAAGSLIASEAGARLSNIEGGDFDIRVPQVLASNGLIHEQMMEIIRKAMR